MYKKLLVISLSMTYVMQGTNFLQGPQVYANNDSSLAVPSEAIQPGQPYTPGGNANNSEQQRSFPTISEDPGIIYIVQAQSAIPFAQNNEIILKSYGIDNVAPSHIFLVRFPANTVFNIVNGDLGTTGTFTTTEVGFANFTGEISNPGTITNGTLVLNGSVTGTFGYEGENFTDGSLSGLIITGFYATGSSTDANTFIINVPATGTVGDGTLITITKSLISNIPTSNILIDGGTFNGERLEVTGGINGTVSQNGALDVSVPSYDAIVTITSACIGGPTDGTPSGVYLPSAKGTQITTPNTISGQISATTNGLIFVGDDIGDGTIDGTNFIAGDCP